LTRLRRAGALLAWTVALAAFPTLLSAGPASVPWEGFTALVVSADGTQYATGGRTGEVLWGEVSTGEVWGRWTVPGNLPVVGLAFGDGTLLAVNLGGAAVTVRRGDPAASPAAPGPLGTAPSRWTAAAPLVKGVSAAQGDLVAVGTPDGKVRVTGGAGGPLEWQAHDAVVTGLAWGPRGAFLLSCSIDGTLVHWDPATGQPRGRL
jgi:hypothetical protein